MIGDIIWKKKKMEKEKIIAVVYRNIIFKLHLPLVAAIWIVSLMQKKFVE